MLERQFLHSNFLKFDCSNWAIILRANFKYLLKDIINLYNCLLKNANFSIKTMNKYHISLNSQFIVVLVGIICFSVRFYGNSLLVLKMHIQVFSFASKKVQGFSSERKILVSLLSVLFHLRNRVSVF